MDLADLPTCLCLNLRMAARAVTLAYDDALRPLGLRVTQFSLLAGVAVLGPVRLSTLADRLALDKTTLPRSLAHLEAAGLVRFSPGTDRREKLVTLTQAGRETLARAQGPWRRTQERLAAALGEGGLPKTLGALRRVRAAVRRGGGP